MTDVLPEEIQVQRQKPLFQRIIFAFGIILIGLLVAIMLIVFKATPDRASREEKPLSVQASTITPLLVQPTIVAHGTVISAREIILQAEVSGRVTAVNQQLLKGGTVKKNEVLITIEDTDYIAQRDVALAALKQAELALQLELGQQAVAKQEWVLLGDSISSAGTRKELALRIPHVEQKQAALVSAQSQVRQARLNLKRTQIRAPFDGLVLSESVDIGSIVMPSTQLARISDSSVFHVNARIPYSSALQLNALSKSSAIEASVQHSDERVRPVTFLHAIRALDARDRMVQLLFAINAPLEEQDGQSSVLLGDYVTVKINSAREVLAYPVPNSALYENDTIWTVTNEQTLLVASKEILFTIDGFSYAKATETTPIQVVTSLLANPLNGKRVAVTSERSGNE